MTMRLSKKRAQGPPRSGTTERSREESEPFFRSLLVNAPDVTCVVDENATITYVSPNVQRVLGFGPEDVVVGTSALEGGTST